MTLPSKLAWRRIEEVFLGAADLSGTERENWLITKCRDDETIRAEVESLLAAEENAAKSLTGAVNDAARSLAEEDNLTGTQLGPWRLQSLIGEGGMGSVYLGLRTDGLFEQRVAIKVLRRGMESVTVLSRFRDERRILAQLSYPGIAQLLDGGSTADGRPFLVMQYVDGLPLDAWCRTHAPTIGDRCRLFLKICEAVAYAHRNLVVHRDLKPSNILIGADGQPHLLDFGIAKLLSSDGHDETVTSLGERPLTPDYASPEQILGLRITTSSDVYSLGAVLFQLLTDVKPHRRDTCTQDELRRLVTETSIERPSVAALSSPTMSARSAEIVGDLDNIVLMAMRREPERRYVSVDQFRLDIESYLQGRPVVARQDTFGYRAGKFFKRHRVAAGAAALVLLSIIFGTAVALREADVARIERDIARRAQAAAEREHNVAEQQRDLAQTHSQEASVQHAKAERRMDELVELANKTLLNIHDQLERIPGATEPRKAVVGTTLEYLDGLVESTHDDRELALVVASGYIKMGDVLGSPLTPNLGDTSGAQKSYEKALTILARLEADFPVTLRKYTALSHLGSLHQEAGKIAEAEKFYKRAMAVSLRVPPSNREDETYLNETANLYLEYSSLEAKLSDKVGIADAQKTVAIREKLAKHYPLKTEYSEALAADYGNLSLLLMTAGRRDEARSVALQTIAARERNSARHPDDVLLKRDLMMGYGRLGDLSGGPFYGRVGGDERVAFDYYKKAVEVAGWLVKADASNQLAGADYATAMMRAGMVLPSSDALPTSVDYLTQSSRIFEETLAKNPRLRFVRANLGLTNEYLARRSESLGKIGEAVGHARKALALAQGMVKDEPDYASARINVMRAWDILVHIQARAGDRSALKDAQTALAVAIDYAAHGPKPERMALFPAEVNGWLGDIYAELAGKAGGGSADWRDAHLAYRASLDAWRKLSGIAPDASARIAEVEKKIAVCDGALRSSN